MKNIVSVILITIGLYGCMNGDGPNNIDDSEINSTKNSGELTIPNVVNGNFTLVAQNTKHEIIQGKSSSVLGYQIGSILGPTIEVESGETLNVNLKNELGEPSNVHWHGLITPADMDGHPEDVVQPGDSKKYTFPVIQRAGLYWYHPHPDGFTAKQAYLGLAGAIIVRDNQEKSIGLPSGEYEMPLIIQDKRMDNKNGLSYLPGMSDIMAGLLGNTIIVNGKASPYINVKTSTYRFRVLNGSNARIYNLALSNGAPFKVIGSDGGLIEKPVTVNALLLSPGERADLLVDFSSAPLGSEIILLSKQFQGGGSQGKQQFNILSVKVNQSDVNRFSFPETLSVIEKTDENTSTITRIFTVSDMGMGGMGSMGGGMTMNGIHRINGKLYDKNRIDETVTFGKTEIWIFDNSKGNEPHPFHVHGVMFQILDRIGGRNIVTEVEKGWKDTVLVLPGEKVRVIMTFSGYKGKFVMHCHNLEHEDDGMMLQFEVI